jgi:hypothetical protein
MYRGGGYTKDGDYIDGASVVLGRQVTGMYASDTKRFKRVIHSTDMTPSNRCIAPVNGAPMKAKETLLASIISNPKSYYMLRTNPSRMFSSYTSTRGGVSRRNMLLPTPTVDGNVQVNATEMAKRVGKLHGRLISVEIECYTGSGFYPTEEGLTTVGGDGSLDSGGIEIKRMTWASNGRLMGLLGLEKKLRGFRVNSKCGLHVHIDARHLPEVESPDRLLHTASETYNRLTLLYPMLKKLVSKSRQRNKYCKWVNNNPESDRYDRRVGRYAAINFEAYRKYKTIEFRCANGSTNVLKIESWALLCRYLFDWCANKNNSIPTNWTGMMAILPPWLSSWCVLRHQKLHHGVGVVDDRVASALDFAPNGNVE